MVGEFLHCLVAISATVGTIPLSLGLAAQFHALKVEPFNLA